MMKISGVVPVLFYFILLKCYYVLGSNPLSGNSQEYELNVETREENDNIKYLNCYLDGLESHVSVVKADTSATKVKDGSTILWSKDNDNGYQSCLGMIVLYESGEKKMLQLLMRTKSDQDPLDLKFYAYENSRWNEKTKDELYQIHLNSRPDRSSADGVEIDVSSDDSPSGVDKITESLMSFTMDLYVPGKDHVIKKVTDSKDTLWDGTSNGKYVVTFVKIRNGSESKKVAFLVEINSKGCDEKFFVYKSNGWEVVDYSDFKSYITKAVAAQMFRNVFSLKRNGNLKNGRKEVMANLVKSF